MRLFHSNIGRILVVHGRQEPVPGSRVDWGRPLAVFDPTSTFRAGASETSMRMTTRWASWH